MWSYLGDVPVYVEPFFGSGAVLLARPHEPKIENVCDADGFVANFWRAVQAEPEAVAEQMNWPIAEQDLEARHKFLCRMPGKAEFVQRVKDEFDYYDVQRAAFWCWGLCAWIGSGWCGGEWYGPDDERNAGRGVNVRDPERGGKLPHLGNAGQGVHKQLPHLGNAGQGECERRLDVLVQWMRSLQDRLRNVRVCCGDWSRICGPTPTFKCGTCGVFLDPPYSGEAGRNNDIYRVENLTVAHDVREWCKELGKRNDMRIVLAGYEGEHNELESIGWNCVEWKAHGGMGVQGTIKNGTTYENKHRERLWLSPHCVGQGTLF